jgi:hypothetical protein
MQPQRKVKTSIYLDKRVHDLLNERRIKERRTLTVILNRALENGLRCDAFNETELPIDVDELERAE